MSNVNVVTLSGSLAADPEVRWTSQDGESAIVRLGIISKFSKKDESGEYVEASTIFDVEVFGKYALTVARKLRKFDNVTVAGRLQKDEWEKDGEKRSKIKVVAQTIDSEGLFRPKSEDATPTATPDAAEAPTQGATTPTGDDIPF